jgi:hypothetical protein
MQPWIFMGRSGAAVAAPTVASVSPAVADTAGGGGIVTITGANLTGASGVTLGGTAATSVTVVNATTITCVPGARAAGASLSILVTTPAGTNGANTLFEYWTPSQMTGIGGYYDANKSASTSSWADQSATAGSATQATGAQQPVVTASSFGALPGMTFDGVKRMLLASKRTQASGRSVFAVTKWLSSVSTTTAYVGNAPLVMVGESGANVQGSFGASAGSIEYADASSGSPHNIRGSTTLNDNVARLVGVTHNSSTNVAKLYVGATQQGADAAITAPYDSRWGWDAIGCGFLAGGDGDGFIGTLGAVIVLDQVAAGSDLTKLNAWARQRFGTP